MGARQLADARCRRALIREERREGKAGRAILVPTHSNSPAWISKVVDWVNGGMVSTVSLERGLECHFG